MVVVAVLELALGLGLTVAAVAVAVAAVAAAAEELVWTKPRTSRLDEAEDTMQMVGDVRLNSSSSFLPD